MEKIVFVWCMVLSLQAGAQFTVRLVVTDVATKKNDDIYITGNFNNWNPRDENYKLKPFGGSRKSIVLRDFAAGTYAFKFSRGAQDKLETTADGRDIPDRVLEVNEDVSKEFTVAGWKDDYPEVPKKYTASPQVRIVDTAFNMPQLGRKRRVWIYLPKGYANSSKLYPVLYMQDGQNLFNEQTAPYGEWGVDEALDTLQQKTGKECIVIGIDNGGDKRTTEYNPYDDAKNGKGEGKQYLEFIVRTLKPFIDSKYRTKKGPENTFIAGSSLGGLISFYAMIKYPEVFGAGGIFSASFWVTPEIFTDAEKFTTTATQMPRFYMYAGKMEPANMVPNNEKMAELLKKNQRYSIRLITDPLGKHREATWRQEFPSFYTWLMNY
ncbi:alpha/beta hydrolase [Sediminibacterium roseum]|uniref:Alpha/beta hydrolase n=1 Tax=Sediminibacterium roseum TaxID=1978412 RepID=A0ABW9ZXN0_9BACT|nr:alpha/beta hydrolase-fold protein [Sediminibacterium roseum]NCI50457.1 alpha/beta hydrolase [Sediminibacterium roseum]